nr:MAG TPA: hypothetical protein [Caudoviricetes sp.]
MPVLSLSRPGIFLFFQYVYSADFCRELNLQISCIFKCSIVQI